MHKGTMEVEKKKGIEGSALTKPQNIAEAIASFLVKLNTSSILFLYLYAIKS
jgi:hypothetical protein